MAQYDLLLIQNVAATGIEFSEQTVNVAKGQLLTVDGATSTPYAIAAGTLNQVLVADPSAPGGMKFASVPLGHTQGTDTGTTNTSFAIDSDGYNVNVTAESASKMGFKVAGGTYADIQAKDATFNKVTVAAAPTAGSDLTNKTYVDGLLAANDAMVFKGTIGTGGTVTALPTTYQTGFTYRVITAGTYAGIVCEVGDLLIATIDRAGTGNVDADWTVVQTNIDGAVVGPASSTDNYVAVFSGTSGKLLKQGGGVLGSAAYTASTAYATAAQGTLASNAIPKGTITAADQVVIGTAASTPSALAVGTSTIVGRASTGSLKALSAAEVLTILNVASGATANTKATGAEINTGTDDVKFATPKAIADSTIVKGPASSVADRIAVFNGTTGKLLKDGGVAIDNLMANWVALPPTSKTAAGTAGQMAYDGNYLYVCKTTGTAGAAAWIRTALASNW